MIWALALSHEKRQAPCRSGAESRHDRLDRLPQNQVMGFNDGPPRPLVEPPGMAAPQPHWEATAYERCSTHPPDIVVKLTVSPEVAMARKPARLRGRSDGGSRPFGSCASRLPSRSSRSTPKHPSLRCASRLSA